MADGDSEYEEEEMVVLAELNGLVDDELLTNGCTFQFVGIDTDKPVLQLGKYNFLGSYEDQIGSALFLKQTTDEAEKKSWDKLCFSDKKLTMQRVFLRKKGEELPPVPFRMTAEDEESETEENEQGAGAEPSSGAAEKGQATASSANTESAAAGDGSDVEMTPVAGSETPSEAPTSAENTPSDSAKS